MKRTAILVLAALLALPLAATGEARGEGKPPLKVLERVNPEYTAEAEAAHVEGKVVLDLTVGAAGKVEKVEVVEPLSHGLTQSAVEAARQWKFEAPKAGKAVLRVTLKFKL